MKDRDPINVTVDTDLEELFPILKLSPEERAARFIEVLDRGLVTSRLSVALPPDLHGEWVHNDPASIAAKEALGFIVDRKYAVEKALHSDGKGSAVVGDVIFMICPRVVKDEIERARQIRYRQDNQVPVGTKEDRQTAADLNQFGRPDHIAPLPMENQLSSVSGADIAAALSTKT